MTKYSGYMGKVLMVDLSKSLISEYPWSDEDRELYIGAKAMASKIMFDNFTGKETAFSEDNLIIVSTGPLPADRDNHILQLRRKFRVLSQKSRYRRIGHPRQMPSPHMD